MFPFSFLSFFFFYFLKIIFPFRNKFTRKPATLPPRRTGCSHFFQTVLISPHTPKQELLRMPRRLESLPVWQDALGAVKAPLPQRRFLIVGHSLGFVFFLSSNLKRHSWVTGTV